MSASLSAAVMLGDYLSSTPIIEREQLLGNVPEVRLGAEYYGSPGYGRQTRQRDLPQRARVLHPTKEPEGDRGGAESIFESQDKVRIQSHYFLFSVLVSFLILLNKTFLSK